MDLPSFGELRGDAAVAEQTLLQHLRDHGVDPEVRFMFTSASADKPPGRGSQESLPAPRARDFAALAERPHWRRELSNFFRAPFELAIPDVDAAHWETVEHYFQAYKLSLVSPAVAASLSMRAAPTSTAPDHLAGKLARKMRKAVLLDAETLARWDRIKWGVMESALRAKFESHPRLATTLQLTLDAHLIHAPARARRHGAVDRHGRLVDHSQWGLMRVRAGLDSATN